MQQSETILNSIRTKKAILLLYQMLLIRAFDEKATERYYKGKIRGFHHIFSGKEAIAVGINQALHEDDNVLSTYHEHGHALARGIDPNRIMAEMYGKLEGFSWGRSSSMHLYDVAKINYRGNAILGRHLPLAIGMALASKKQKQTPLTCCFFGEGAAAEGEFQEAINLAALWKVPVLFVYENNRYAMGTAINYNHTEPELEKKGSAYGMESSAVDGMSLNAVVEAANLAVEKVRQSGNPYLLVCNTYRFQSHSKFDVELYRDKEEVEGWKKRDPIPKYEEFLLQQEYITHVEIDQMKTKIQNKIQKAVAFSEAGSFKPLEQLTEFVYSESTIKNSVSWKI